MSDVSDKPDDETAEAESSGPLAGERLAEARREQQIPIIEIAKELHLDEHKVRALERNDFDVIGAPVFAKGHLKKYAQLVQVDDADVMADYYRLERSAGPPLVVGVRRRQRDAASVTPWVVTILVVLLAAIAYWWFFVRDTVTTQPVIEPSVQLPQVSTDATDAPDTEDAVGSEPVEDASEELQVPVEPEPQAVTTPAANNIETQLSITYLGDCWTEISDASGRRLFFDLGTSGRTVDLSGEAPFNVLFGDADNATIRVNGEAFEIPAASRRGRTAKLTISGS